MKKLALILALIIIPCSAFGLEMLNDSTMDGITGQSGVSIAFDDLQIFINIDTMAYIDCDGFNSLTGQNCTGAGGALAIQNFQIDVLNINAILSSTIPDGGTTNNGTTGNSAMGLYSSACGDIPLFYNYGSMTALTGCYLNGALSYVGGLSVQGTDGLNNYTAIGKDTTTMGTASNGFQAQALSIDVTDKLPALSAGWVNNWAGTGLAGLNVGGVMITVPTMEIYINSMTFTPYYTGMVGTHASHAANDVYNAKHVLNVDANFGTFEIDGITVAILSGWLEIAPH